MVRKKASSPYLWYDFRLAGVRYRGSTKQTVLAKARTFESVLMKVMGHSSLATTARYLHPETADLGSIMDNRNATRNDTLYQGRPQ